MIGIKLVLLPNCIFVSFLSIRDSGKPALNHCSKFRKNEEISLGICQLDEFILHRGSI